MFVLLGFGEVAFLVATEHRYQNGVDVLAAWAASEMAERPGESWTAGWGGVVRSESERTGCGDLSPDVSFPDGGHDHGDRVLVSWSCSYRPHLTSALPVLAIRVASEAVVPGAAVPTAGPSPSPSATAE